MTGNELEEIALRFFQGKATREEERLLHQWFDEYKNRQDETIYVDTNTKHKNSKDVKERLYTTILAKVKNENQANVLPKISGKQWIRYAAASILLLLSIGGVYYFSSEGLEEPVRYTQLLDGDVGPGGNNAILELADGSVINLDDVAVGEVSSIGGMQFKKQADGLVAVELGNNRNSTATEYNTIRTPAGGQYQIALPDGTKVWLNASSSIVFPTIFDDAYREVTVHGEAYFEVAKASNTTGQIPFFVLSGSQRIEVLGTHFNVSDYPGESTRTVLVEGAVRVHSLQSDAAVLLKPGQQADQVGNQLKVNRADLESAIAWKNGDFIFNNETLSSIMKKLERWYDIDVEYNDAVVLRKFSGAISRSRNLSDVLKIMEFTGRVTFKIEGRRVTVMM